MRSIAALRSRLWPVSLLLLSALAPVVLPAQGVTPVAPSTITFADAIRLVLNQNVSVRQAQNTVESGSATIRQRQSAFLPSFSLSTSTSEAYGYNFNQTEGKIVDQTTTALSLGASSGVTLFDGGRNLAALRESRLTNSANGNDLTRARQTAVFTAASNFLSLVQREEQVRVQRDNLAAQQAQDSVIQRLVKAGARPISDQYQQQATVASAQYSLVSAQRDLEVARITLIRTLQLDPQGHYAFVAPAVRDSVPVRAFNLDSLLGRALTSREDLKALDTRLSATTQTLKSAASARLPQVSLSLGYNTAFNSASTLPFNTQLDQRRNGSLGVSLSLPVFDRNVASVAVQQARISADNARLALQDRRQAVAADVRQAYLDHDAAVQQLAAAQAQLAAAQLAATTQARRYDVGAGTLVEVTTARAQLVQAASAVVSAKYAVAFQQSLMAYYVGDLVPEAVTLN